MHEFLRRLGGLGVRRNARLETGPIAEAVFARQSKLRVSERDALLVRERVANAIARFRVARFEGSKQLFGQRLLLVEVRTGRKLPAET